MPLSEHEQRLLDEMERNLYQAEADEVDTDDVRRPHSLRSVVLGMVLVLAGLAVLLAGVTMKSVIVGVVGFVAMVAGVVLAMTPTGHRGQATSSSASASGPHRRGPSLSERLEERWQRRSDGHQ